MVYAERSPCATRMLPSTPKTMRRAMTEDDIQWMAHYGITSEQKEIYRFRGKVYDRLEDAINYAKIVTDREKLSEIQSSNS